MLFNRVWCATSTVGTGSVTPGSAVNATCLSFATANGGSAIANGTTVTYELEEGNDFEIGRGVFTSGTLTRATVLISKIGGSVGTTKMTLAGAATVRIVAAAEDFVTTTDNNTVSGVLTVTNGTNSSSPSTGALIVSSGGLGVAGNAAIGGNIALTGILSAVAKGHQLGAPGGNLATGALVPGDANVLGYNAGSGNWAGFGVDNNGYLWFRVGLSGTGASALYFNSSDLSGNFLVSPKGPTPSANDNSTKFATTAYVDRLIPGMMVSTVQNVNFNSANTDNAIPILLPPGVTNYLIFRVILANASASLSTATLGIFGGTAGTNAITANAAITVTTAAANTNNNMQTVFSGNATTWFNYATVYARVGTAQGSAATGDVSIHYLPLP